ncbi:MAG: hypothetical protein D6728_14370 [Cyanobacteria bacterium J055]|nr:MAG: hypothetical protein D6728_14370 [Cyanobacteria bacterium J055]
MQYTQKDDCQSPLLFYSILLFSRLSGTIEGIITLKILTQPRFPNSRTVKLPKFFLARIGSSANILNRGAVRDRSPTDNGCLSRTPLPSIG